jgi:hypothetical protein
MYSVTYYMTAGTRVSRVFDSLHAAIEFSIYNVGMGDLYGIDRV